MRKKEPRKREPHKWPCATSRAHGLFGLVLKAAMEVPALVKEMPDGPEKDEAANTYRMMMGKLYISFCEVEKAFLKNDLESVTSIVDTLKKMKKEGHEKFVKEDE